MKKNLLFLALVIGATFMNAQNVIWSDDFEDEDISDWTIHDEDGDSYIWRAEQVKDELTGAPLSPLSSLVSLSFVNGVL